MYEQGPATTLRKGFGWVLILAGIAVFAIRLQHPGPYAFPGGGNLRAGLLALLFGAWLSRDWLRAGHLSIRMNGLAVVFGVVVLFFALYATLAELEETVTLHARDRAGEPAALRLWIVDRDDGAWVTMRRSKAVEHRLDGARLRLLRDGAYRCVVPTLVEDRETFRAIHALRHEKYAVQRLAMAIGAMERDPPDGVALRLDPCPEA